MVRDSAAAAGSHAWWDGHMREVLSGATTAFVLKGASALLTFLLYVTIGRLVGPAGAGTYFLALTVATVAAVLGRIGLDNTLLRFVAAHASIGDWSGVQGVYSKATRLALVASALTALLVALTAHFVANTVFRKPELEAPLRWMAIAIVPMALLSLQAQALQALKRIGDSSIVGNIAVPALALTGVLLFAPRWGAAGAVAAYSLAATLSMLYGIQRWRARTPQLRALPGAFDTSALLRSCIPLFWVSAFQLVIAWSSTLSLGLFGSVAEVGIFGAANRTAMLISTVLMAVNSISAPKFAALHKQGDLETLGQVAQKSAKLMALVASPIVAIFLLLPTAVMGIFGAQFRPGAATLSILAVGQFVNVVTGSVGWILIMCGHERLMRNNIALCAALSVALNLALVPKFGMIGAALATAIALSLQMVIGAVLVWRKLGVMTIPLWTGRVVRSSHARTRDPSA